MEQKPLIVGIDPGITTAYAILNTQGEVLRLKSGKELTLNKMLAEIIPLGKIVLIGTDVKYSPAFIEKFAARVSARIIAPREDVKVGLKERMTKRYAPRDSHQRDALAAALLAYREVEQTLRRVVEILKEKGREHKVDQIQTLVLKGKSIAQALAEEEQQESVQVQVRKRIKSRGKASRLREENMLLQREKKQLEGKVAYLDQKMRQLVKKTSRATNEQLEQLLRRKDDKIQQLDAKVKAVQQEWRELHQKKEELKELLIKSKEFVIAKKCRSLGWEEIAEKGQEGDILFIEDSASFSQKSLEYVKEKGVTLILGDKPGKELQKAGIMVVNGKKLALQEKEGLIFIKKEQWEQEKKKKDVLSSIIEEYKEERKRLI